MDKKLPKNFAGAFKDADIRGVTIEEIDDDLAYCIARAFVDEFKHKKVVVGYDMRVSTPALTEAFMNGVTDAGADVVNIGLAHSPMLYFASGYLDLPGAMITASHSPKNYNGLKLVMPGAVPLTKPTGLNAILKRIKQGKFSTPKRKGKRLAKYVGYKYRDYLLKKVKTKQFKDLQIVVDAGNGMAGVLMPLLEKKLPTKFKTILGDLDGRFPNRDSDPTLRKNQRFLVKELKTGQYDFGIAFDGDADRIAFLDEKGRYVNCAVIGSLIAERILRDEPGSKHVFTNLTSRVYEESIVGSGGKAVRAKVGHAFLKRKMRDTKAVFGCEHSGHFFFRDFFYTDSVVLTFLYVADVYLSAKKEGRSFSKMVAPYLKYEQLEDVVIDVKDKKKSLQKVLSFVKKQFPKATVKEFDGLYITTDKTWGAVKPSVTEHAIKIMFEGHKKNDASKMQDKLVAYVRKIANE